MTRFAEGSDKTINDPDYATLKARVFAWDHDGTTWQNIGIRPCTKEELGLGPSETIDQSRFYPASHSAEHFIEENWN